MSKLKDTLSYLQTKRIVVLGAGLTGLSCVSFLKQHNIECAVNDSRKEIVGLELADYGNAEFHFGSWNEDLLSNADVAIASPGIDLEKEGITELLSAQCDLIGDVELFCRINDKPIIAVTGSNGKSTVVSLLAYVGEQLGYSITLAGNIGTPVLSQPINQSDFIVLELSSFQLETIKHLNALAATVLNVSDDHLDRHQTIDKYADIKNRIFIGCQHKVVNRLETTSAHLLESCACTYGKDMPTDTNFGVAKIEGELALTQGEKALIELKALPLAGLHNAENYAAVLALGVASGWSLNDMLVHLAGFKGLEHRCQRVESNSEKQWINDSKATNVGAAIAAIDGLASGLGDDASLILIAGGDGKGADFRPLAAIVHQKIKHCVVLGKDAAVLKSLIPQSVLVSNIEEAVSKADALSRAGDLVLLSPACASIDMYRNYMERGERFTSAVKALDKEVL